MNLRVYLCFLLLLCSGISAQAQESALDRIARTGVLRVGTPGDYRPFSSLEADGYRGYDVDLARMAADELGVQVEFVPTSWNSLVEDLRSNRFDLAVGGVTRTLKRERLVGFTDPIMVLGKCALVRKGDSKRFDSLTRIDVPGVIVAVNPGGTNEAFVKEHLSQATLRVVPDNLSIPEMIATGAADVMITDSVEAMLAANNDSRLTVVDGDHPWTRESLGWATARDDQAFLNWLNLFLYQAEADGRLPALRRKYGL